MGLAGSHHQFVTGSGANQISRPLSSLSYQKKEVGLNCGLWVNQVRHWHIHSFFAFHFSPGFVRFVLGSTLKPHGNHTQDYGCFPLCHRFRKFRSEFKWKRLFRFLPTGIFGITSRGGPLISVGIFRSKFAVPFLTNRFFVLIREFGNDKKWQGLFLLVGAV